MPKVSRETLREVQQALKRYETEVEATHLAGVSKQTYIVHTRHFVRWLNDAFTPGKRTG